MSQEWLHSNTASKLDSSAWLGSTKWVYYKPSISFSLDCTRLWNRNSHFLSESQLVQQSIAKYGQKVTKAPPVTKSGIQEHLLAIITTCNLVSHYHCVGFNLKLSNKSFQPFRFVEHPALQDFITFLNHKIKDDDILHKSSIANAVNGKVLQLESLCSTLLRYVAHASICAGPY